MSWRELTEDDLLTAISGDELASVRAAALAEGQDDPVAPTISQVTQMVRGYIAGCTENVLDADPDKLPEELISAAVAILVPKLLARAAGLSIDSADVRRNAAESAERLLRDVAACRFKLVQPEDVSTEPISSPSPRFPSTRRTRRFDRECSQDGI